MLFWLLEHWTALAVSVLQVRIPIRRASPRPHLMGRLWSTGGRCPAFWQQVLGDQLGVST